jgi:hypothetical protein
MRKVNYEPIVLGGNDIDETAVFDAIFGYSQWTMDGYTVLGFIEHKPYRLEWGWRSNRVTLHAIGERVLLLRSKLRKIFNVGTQHVEFNAVKSSKELEGMVIMDFYVEVTE